MSSLNEAHNREGNVRGALHLQKTHGLFITRRKKSWYYALGMITVLLLAYWVMLLLDRPTQAIAKRFTQVSAGSYHTLGISSQSQVYAWGWNGNGQLGTGSTTDATTPVAVQTVGTPMDGKVITQVVAGGNFSVGYSLALASDGTVYAWGANNNGQLGDGTTTNAVKPVKVALPTGTVVTRISTGAGFSIALTANNEIYAWGQNNYGQLGNGSTVSSTTPVLVNTGGVMTGKTIIDIDSGTYNSLALASDGTIFAWGRNNYGQLGDGTTSDRSNPIKVQTPAGVTFTSISAGGGYGWTHNEEIAHSLATTNDGRVYAWGSNLFGQIGGAASSSSTTPVSLSPLGPMTGKKITSVVAGAGHSMAIDVDGKLYAWGKNYSYQLGDGTASNTSTPVAVNVPADKKFISIAAGGYDAAHSAAVDVDGNVYAWGRNSNGQLGDGTTTDQINPTLVKLVGTPSAPVNIAAAASDGSVTVSWAKEVATRDDTVTAYRVEYRKVGETNWHIIDTSAAAMSQTITGLVNEELYQVRVAALAKDEPGDYSTTIFARPHATPTITAISPDIGSIAGNESVTITGNNFTVKNRAVNQVSVGDTFSSVVASDGTVHSHGDGNKGQLGNGTNTNSSIPVAVKTTGTPMAGKTIVQVANGASHSLALASDGTVYTWGSNNDGQLGDGTTNDSSIPVAVKTTGTPMAGKTIVQVASGGSFSLALASDGTLYSWGSNNKGQLGNNATANSSTPVAVATVGTSMAGKKIVQVAAGKNHVVALASDGIAYVWGDNDSGQLGNSVTTSQVMAPVAVKTFGTPISGKTIIQVTAGDKHTSILTSDNMIYSWGSNTFGQLGDGTTNDSPAPVALKTSGTPMAGKTIVQIDAGAEHSLALTVDGTVYSWGSGASGQLGNNTTANSSTPVAVNTTGTPMAGKAVVQIDAGGKHSAALAEDGTAYMWGQNTSGQLGNNTTSNSPAPVSVVIDKPSSLASAAPKVTFGGLEATNIQIVDSTKMIVTNPAHAVGLVPVSVDLGDGDTAYQATKSNGYTYITVPNAPTNLTAVPLENGIKLNWTTPSDSGGSPIVDYTVQYSDDNGLTWHTYPHASTTATGMTIPSGTLNPGTKYSFKVAAVNKAGVGTYSNTVVAQLVYITVQAAANVDIAITPSGSSTMSSNKSDVLVATNSPSGYKLSLAAATTDRRLLNGSSAIQPTTGSMNSPTALSGVSWGYRVGGIGGFGTATTIESNTSATAYTWAAVPAMGIPDVIRTTSIAKPIAEPTTVWYGASVAGAQQSGVYKSTVTYTAITN